MWMLWVALAGAGEPEEIVVWGDRFARWDRRWWVETEAVFYQPLVFRADENHELNIQAVQLRAVLDCARDGKLGPDRIEANCRVEDVSVTVGTGRRERRQDQRVLDQLDAKLTEAVLQVQASGVGGVPNVDLEGVTSTNSRERDAQEVMRQLASRMILPFHLQYPAAPGDGVVWEEHDSRLMSIHSRQASYGNTRLVHYLNAFEGHWVVQSIGGGTIGRTIFSVQRGPSGAKAYVPVGVDFFKVTHHGVAVIEPDTGILTERTWVVSGTLSPSSFHGMFGAGGFSYRGRLALLDPDEWPSVGPSRLVEAPGTRVRTDLPAWEPLAE